MSESRYAVLIASSQFPGEPKLKPLRAPERDVDGLNEVLSSEQLGGFSKVLVLKNESSYEVLPKILSVLNQAGRNDTVLIYYSGHGKLDRQGNLHLATNNTVVDVLQATSIPVATVLGYVKNAPCCNKVALILDCCFSGSVGKAITRGSVEDQLQLVSAGTYILTASTANEIAEERETDQYGLFTKHIIEGIQSGAADSDDDGIVTMDELYSYVHKQMLAEGSQRPMKWDLERRGDLIIARTGKSPREERRKAIRERLWELYRQDILPLDVFKKALEVNENPSPSGVDAQLQHLLNQLLQGLKVGAFIGKWYEVVPLRSSALAPSPADEGAARPGVEVEKAAKAERERQDRERAAQTEREAPEKANREAQEKAEREQREPPKAEAQRPAAERAAQQEAEEERQAPLAAEEVQAEREKREDEKAAQAPPPAGEIAAGAVASTGQPSVATSQQASSMPAGVSEATLTAPRKTPAPAPTSAPASSSGSSGGLAWLLLLALLNTLHPWDLVHKDPSQGWQWDSSGWHLRWPWQRSSPELPDKTPSDILNSRKSGGGLADTSTLKNLKLAEPIKIDPGVSKNSEALKAWDQKGPEKSAPNSPTASLPRGDGSKTSLDSSATWPGWRRRYQYPLTGSGAANAIISGGHVDAIEAYKPKPAVKDFSIQSVRKVPAGVGYDYRVRIHWSVAQGKGIKIEASIEGVRLFLDGRPVTSKPAVDTRKVCGPCDPEGSFDFRATDPFATITFTLTAQGLADQKLEVPFTRLINAELVRQ